MGISELDGIVPILPTPLTADREVDEAGVAHLVEFCVHQGFDGAVVLGSNGEFPYLSFEEKRRVMAAAARAAEGRLPVIGTASAFGTEEAVALARAAKEAGCSAVLAALCLYFDIGLPGVERHYETLAREGGLPVFFYHFPEVTGLRLGPAEVATIAAIDGVVGAKLSVVNKRYLRGAIQATRARGWRVFTGLSFLLLSCLEYGGAGVFCPLPLVAPGELKELLGAFRRGERARARALHRRLLRALPLLGGPGGPAALQALGFELLAGAPLRGPGRRAQAGYALLKEALRLQGHPIGNAVKPPFDAVGEAQRQTVRRTLDALGWLPAG